MDDQATLEAILATLDPRTKLIDGRRVGRQHRMVETLGRSKLACDLTAVSGTEHQKRLVIHRVGQKPRGDSNGHDGLSLVTGRSNVLNFIVVNASGEWDTTYLMVSRCVSQPTGLVVPAAMTALPSASSARVT